MLLDHYNREIWNNFRNISKKKKKIAGNLITSKHGATYQ